MKNDAKLAEVFAQISELMAEAAVLIHSESAEKEEPKVEKKSEEKTETAVEKKTVAKKTKKDDMTAPITAEQADKMKFNELKRYAKELGISATGKRADIIKRILEAQDGKTTEEPKKKSKQEKKSNVVDFEEKKEELAKYEQEADDLLEENEVDEVISELKKAGMKGVTKKNVKKKLIEALKDNLLDLGDDDDEDEDEEDVEEEVEETEEETEDDSDDEEESEEYEDDEDEESDEVIDESTYFEEYDDGTNDPDSCDKKRLKAMKKVQKKILADVESGDLSTEDMREYIMENSTVDEREEVETFDDDDILATYCEMRKRLIDDDGDDVSDEPENVYYINGKVYCHAHKCKEVDGDYLDEVEGEKFSI